MKKILLSLAFLAGVSLTVSAQFKIGGKTINTKKVINAATDVAHAATLSDEDVAKMAKEYIQWMDTHNEVAGPDTEMGQRLERLTANVKKVSGLDLNFKVYNVVDVNAFACGDGSVRVCGGLMKIMDDDEVFAVIGHEIGHVVHSDSKDAMKNAYLTSAAKNAAVIDQHVGVVRAGTAVVVVVISAVQGCPQVDHCRLAGGNVHHQHPIPF